MSKVQKVLVWLMTIFLGISVGAGLYEARIMVPLWKATQPEVWINTGTQFWAFVTSGPLTLILLVSLFFSWRSARPVRNWWIAALGITVLERAATFGYFIPTMFWLQNQTGESAEFMATLETWALLNHGRHILSISAWLLALKALSLIGTTASKR